MLKYVIRNINGNFHPTLIDDALAFFEEPGVKVTFINERCSGPAFSEMAIALYIT